MQSEALLALWARFQPPEVFFLVLKDSSATPSFPSPPEGKIGLPRVALGVKNQPANAGDIRDVDLIPGLGRSPGGGHSNPLQYSCLENPMDRGAW